MANDSSKSSELASILEELGPEGRKLYEEAMALSDQKKKVMVTGYLLALAAIVIGLPLAYYRFGQNPVQNNHWMFFLPLPSLDFFFLFFLNMPRPLVALSRSETFSNEKPPQYI